MIEQIFVNIFTYTPVYNTIFGIISGLLSFLVAYRASKIYTETFDKRMAIIAAGFMLGGLFEIIHAMTSYTKGILFYYVFFRNLSFSGSIFISLFLDKNNIHSKNNNFKKKLLIFCFVYFLLVILFQKLSNPVFLEQSVPYASIQIVFTALYFLLSLLYLDIRIDYKLKPISPLVIGLFIYSLSELYIITPGFLSSLYRFIIHIEDLVGLLFIYWGIKDFCLKQYPLNSRQKLLIFSSAILLGFYWIVILSELLIFNLQIPIYFKYYIFLFFITTVIIQYVLSIKIAGPIDKPIKSIKTTFIVTTLLIITIILVLHSFISLYVFKVYTENQTRKYLKSTIENESNKFYSDIKNVETINLISSRILKNFSVEYLNPIIKDNFKLNPLIFGSGVFLEPNAYESGVKYYGPYWYKNKNGNINFTWAYSRPEYNYFQYDWYRNGFIPNTNIVWNEPNIDDIAKIAIMSVTSPIRRNNNIIGIFVTDVKLSSFQNYVAKMKVGKSGHAFIISDQGYYISYVKSRKILQDKITNDKNINIRKIGEKIIKAQKTEISRVVINDVDLFVIYTPIGNTKLKMVFILPASEIYAYINKRLVINIVLLFMSIILFSIIFTLLFAKTLVKPLDNLIQTVDKVAKGDLSVRTSVKTKDEIALFADSLNYMIESLQNLVNKEKQNMEREVLLRNLINTIRSTLNINEIKQTFVNEIGKFFKADRVIFAEFNQREETFLPIDRYSEYVSDQKFGSLVGYDWSLPVMRAFIQPLKEQREINITNLDTYLKKHNLENTDFAELFKEWNIKSGYNIVITYGDEIMGFFCIDYLSKYFEIGKEDLEFLRTIANQAGIALHQAKLYDTTKIQADREALIRKITETIRSTLNINETLDIITSEIAQIFKADRVTISQIKDGYKTHKVRSEYLSKENIKGIKNSGEERFKVFEYLTNQTFPSDKALSFDNIAESNAPAYIKDFYKNLNVNSLIVLPIKKESDEWGIMTLSYTDKYKFWTEKEKSTLKSIADQVYIAIKQSELYTTTKLQADREALLRKLVEVIRSSLDINETLNIICDEVAKVFNVQRATIIQFSNPKNYEDYIIRREYKVSPDIKGITDPNYLRKTAAYWGEKTLKENQNLFIDNILNSDTPDYFKKSYESIGAKSILGFPIQKGNDKWGIFVLSEYNYYRHWTRDEIQLLETISNQVYMAIKQAELFTTTKEYADKEKLIRETISEIRSSLDVRKIISTFVFELGKLFGVTRSFFSKYDQQNNVFLTPDEYSEYRCSQEVRSYREFGENLETPYPFFSAITRTAKEPIIMTNSEVFIKEHNLEGMNDAKSLREYNVAATVVVPIIYSNRLIGMYVFDYNKPISFPQKELDFVKVVSDQTAVALYQAELFSTTKEYADREAILRRIIEAVRSTMELDEIFNIVAQEIIKLFKVQRVAIAKIDPYSQASLIYKEYKTNENIKDSSSVPNFELVKEYWIKDLLTKSKTVFIDNIPESDTPDYFKDIYKVLGVKSIISIPVKSGEITWGRITLSEYNYYRKWSEKDVNLLETIAGQLYTAIRQAELYLTTKNQADRENSLRRIISKISSSLDINEIKTAFVTEIGKILNSDQNAFYEINPENNLFLPVDKYSVYISSPDIKSLVGVNIEDYRYGEFFRKDKKEIIILNTKDFIRDYNLSGSRQEQFVKDFDIKSSIVVPVTYGEQLFGMFAINFVKNYRNIAEDDVNFVRTLANQAGIALYQSKLYNREKQTAERETLLRNIISTIRSTLGINETKNILVNEIGKTFNADRVFIIEFDSETNTPLVLDKYSEYLASPDLKSFVGFDFSSSKVKLFAQIHKQFKPIIIDNVEKYIKENNLENTEEEQWLRESSLKSGVGIVLSYGNKIFGVLTIHYVKKYVHFTKEQIEFLETIADQAGIALYQTKLYDKEKQTAEREALLRKVVETMRSSLDIDEILTIICDEVGKLFNVERAAIIDLSNIRNYGDFIVRREYKTFPYIKGLGNIEFDKKTAAYWAEKIFKEKKSIAIDNISTSDTPDYFKETYKSLGVKSVLGVPIKKGNNMWGNFVLSEYNYYRHWTEDDIKLLETIADQVYIAIKQAELYTATKEYAEREKILREIVTIIRSTLDVNEIKKNVVKEIGKLFHADRCYFRVFDKKTNMFISPDVEYLSSPEVKSLINVQTDQEGLKYFLQEFVKNQEGTYPIEMNEKLAKGTPVEKYLKDRNIKADFALLMWETDEEIVYLVLHYIKEEPLITEEDKKLMETIAKQISIAFDQSRLYESVKQTAEKERLLREIISEIKIFQTFDQAYNYILEKMTEIFDADRSIFVEVPTFIYEKPLIKYEYLRNANLSAIKDKQLPASCQQMFIEISKNFNTVVVNYVNEYHVEQEEVQQFFKDNQVKSFIAAPFAKYDKEVKFFGILALCSTKARIWSSKEIELLKSIIESTTAILWEISKFNEINELRNTFILTLAHDLQVPLVGEKRALEFLESRSGEQPIGKFKEFITETLKSNQNLFNLLTMLLESYYYESGKKQLSLVDFNIGIAINQVVDKLKELAQSKSMKINIEIEKALPNLKLDKDGIEKALYYLIENAIIYTQPNGQIVIKSYKLQNEVITCVSDNGPGIEPEIQERIFKRYEMAQAIERKIGSGLSLYLTKQIIEAHKGRIWFETEQGVGTIFCFVLPIQ